MRHLYRLFVVSALFASTQPAWAAAHKLPTTTRTQARRLPLSSVDARLAQADARQPDARQPDTRQPDTRQPEKPRQTPLPSGTVKQPPVVPAKTEPHPEGEMTRPPTPSPPNSKESSGIIPLIIGLLLLFGLVFLFGSALARKRRQLAAEIDSEKAAVVGELKKRKAIAEEAEEPRVAVPAKKEKKPAVALVEDEAALAEAQEELAPQEAAATIADGLAKTQREGFIARLGSLFKGKVIDESLLDELEEVLFTADIGVKTAQHLLDTVRDKLSKKELKNAEMVWATLKEETLQILEGSVTAGTAWAETPPHVIMVVGVNGTGKTTTIGKLANHFSRKGTRVLLAAGDTFRAAAVEQLAIWGERVDVPVHKGKSKADPASVIFDAVQRGIDENFELVIADTAGRLHTAANLMEELKKIRRVVQKVVPEAPHEVLLVLDATMGQNSIQQANQFKAAMDVTGIVLTKLDGTAKGGVIIAISKEMGIPIRYVGVGEKIQDLQPFSPREFVDALFVPLED